ncbi:hypothetical protein ID866_6205 [Astraeus odoratus]|nr:hypothetical protein ID866_6205 [Astraeus odoratus]
MDTRLPNRAEQAIPASLHAVVDSISGVYTDPAHGPPTVNQGHGDLQMDSPSVLERLSKQASYTVNLNGQVALVEGTSPVRGSSSLVYEGILRQDAEEVKVAVKVFHSAPPGDMTTLKRILREVHICSKLHHENIIRTLGISTDFGATISIISRWMEMGDAHTFVQNTDHDPRPLLLDIAAGLNYLHTLQPGPVFHGDLKGFNVLVSDEHSAVLANFGLSDLTESSFSMSVVTPQRGSFPWMAPEFLDNYGASAAGDVWAFGMTVLHSEPPDIESNTFSLLKEVFDRAVKYSMNLNGQVRLDKGQESLQGSRALVRQGILTQDEGQRRVTVKTPRLTSAGDLNTLKCILRECIGVEDALTYVQDNENDPQPLLLDIAAGLCYLHSHEQGICHGDLKGSNVLVSADRRAYITEFSLSTLTISSLSMPRDVNAPQRNSFVWMAPEILNGGDVSYASDVWAFGMTVLNVENDPRPLLLDIASALHYLHKREAGPIFHGDLKGANILVSGDRRALLCDFGLSTLTQSSFSMSAPTVRTGGSLPWMAPELLDDNATSAASDIWSFGMTALELFTRSKPFHECVSVTGLISRIIGGKLPGRPDEDATCSRMTDAWWELCLSCWERERALRPEISKVLKTIQTTMSHMQLDTICFDTCEPDTSYSAHV